MNILEVGSGIFPLASAFHTDIVRNSNLNLICDCQRLPFKDKMFDLVYASHVLEHMSQPIFALEEFKRVGKASFLRVPNGVSMGYRIDHYGEHLYSWNKTTFHNLLSTVFDSVDVGQTLRLVAGQNFFRKCLVYATVAFSCKNELTAFCK